MIEIAVPTYYGKYRARVHDIKDPEKRGRIKVVCPKVLGNAVSNWCEPCVPVAYEHGGDFAIPKINDTVWVEFEGGDVNKPIYVGNWWSKNSTPSSSYETKKRIIEWDGCLITMTGGNAGKATLEIKVGESKIGVTENSISIISPKITILEG